LVGKICSVSIGVDDFDIRQVTVSDELLSALHLFSAAFYTDYPACGTDALGEQTETTLWTTTDLDNSPTLPHTDLVKQPA
jgi:hypothetical protein